MFNLSKERKKESIEAYKRRKTIGGIYAIRSKASGAPWVGRAPDLSTIWNRRAFELRSGHCRCRSLQDAWNLQGPDDFTFEVIERIDAEELSFALERVMKERLGYWCASLSALRLE